MAVNAAPEVRDEMAYSLLHQRTRRLLPSGAGYFRLKGFLASVAVLTTGTAFGQAIALISLPLVTRLYSPSDMGVYGLFIAFMGVASTAVALRYEVAIVSAARHSEAAALFGSANLIGVPVSIGLSAVLYGLHQFSVLGYEQLPLTSILFVFPALIASNLFVTLRYTLMRHGDFGTVARVTVSQNVARVGVQLGLALGGGTWVGLVAGEVAGRFAGIGTMVRAQVATIGGTYRTLSRRRLKAVLGKHRAFPLYNLPSSLFDALAIAAPIPILAQHYGAAAAGVFALTQRALQLPLVLVGKSVADVFHARLASEARGREPQLTNLFFRTTAGLVAVGVVPFVLIILFARPVFPAVFGSDWSDAGATAVALAPWAYIQFVVGPLSRAVLVLNGQRLKLLFDVTSLIAATVPLVVARQLELSIVSAVWILSLSQVVAYVVYYGVLVMIVFRSQRRA